jgi:hypothetical protein
MALIYATGHDLTLSINSVTYDDICSSATLSVESDQQVIETLSGRAYKTVSKSGTLDVELYQDWTSVSSGGTSNSVCKALWNLANTAPDTSFQATLKVKGATGTATVYTFNVFPVFPPLGGGANDVLTTSLSFIVEDGSVVATTV